MTAEEYDKLWHKIVARHKALIRMFKEDHDLYYGSPAITSSSCDCISVLLKENGFTWKNEKPYHLSIHPMDKKVGKKYFMELKK